MFLGRAPGPVGSCPRPKAPGRMARAGVGSSALMGGRLLLLSLAPLPPHTASTPHAGRLLPKTRAGGKDNSLTSRTSSKYAYAYPFKAAAIVTPIDAGVCTT